MKQTYQVNAMDLKKLRLLETETVASVLQNIANAQRQRADVS